MAVRPKPKVLSPCEWRRQQERSISSNRAKPVVGLEDVPVFGVLKRKKNPHPWEQGPNEPEKEYLAFSFYRDLGLDRTYADAFAKYNGGKARVPPYYKQWAYRFKWRDRAKLYDEYLMSLEFEKRAALVDVKAHEWNNRRELAREKKWELGLSMLEQAKEMMAYPITQVEEKETTAGPVSITKPAKWFDKTAATTLARTGSELINDAVGKQVVAAPSDKKDDEPDMSKLTMDELLTLRDIIARASPEDEAAAAVAVAPAS